MHGCVAVLHGCEVVIVRMEKSVDISECEVLDCCVDVCLCCMAVRLL